MTFLYGLLSDRSIMAPLQSQGAGEDDEHRSDGNQRKRARGRDGGHGLKMRDHYPVFKGGPPTTSALVRPRSDHLPPSYLKETLIFAR